MPNREHSARTWSRCFCGVRNAATILFLRAIGQYPGQKKTCGVIGHHRSKKRELAGWTPSFLHGWIFMEGRLRNGAMPGSTGFEVRAKKNFGHGRQNGFGNSGTTDPALVRGRGTGARRMLAPPGACRFICRTCAPHSPWKKDRHDPFTPAPPAAANNILKFPNRPQADGNYRVGTGRTWVVAAGKKLQG